MRDKERGVIAANVIRFAIADVARTNVGRLVTDKLEPEIREELAKEVNNRLRDRRMMGPNGDTFYAPFDERECALLAATAAHLIELRGGVA